MLTNNDYRAALFQAYSAARWSMNKQKAYSYARAVIKPLPETRTDAVIRLAFRDYIQDRAFFGSEFSPRANWRVCYSHYRESL